MTGDLSMFDLSALTPSIFLHYAPMTFLGSFLFG